MRVKCSPASCLASGSPASAPSRASAPTGRIELAELGSAALADAIARLLDYRERRSREGVAFVAGHTWEHSIDDVEAGPRRGAAHERPARALG
jgi:hypothetical protein